MPNFPSLPLVIKIYMWSECWLSLISFFIPPSPHLSFLPYLHPTPSHHLLSFHSSLSPHLLFIQLFILLLIFLPYPWPFQRYSPHLPSLTTLPFPPLPFSPGLDIWLVCAAGQSKWDSPFLLQKYREAADSPLYCVCQCRNESVLAPAFQFHIERGIQRCTHTRRWFGPVSS